MMYRTEQEKFWAGKFGNDYIKRNQSEFSIAANLFMWGKILNHTVDVKSVIEFGANIGLNLIAQKQLLPGAEFSAVEINKNAVKSMDKLGFIKTYSQSILDFKVDYKRDFVFTRGVLIHMNPDVLDEIYETMYNTSSKYICIAEYYNPVPSEVKYRGFNEKLFKRDFAGEMLKKFKKLHLVDYGFIYHLDKNFPQDDINYFLLSKK